MGHQQEGLVALSQFFVLSPRGDPIIFRDCSYTPSRPVCAAAHLLCFPPSPLKIEAT